MTVYLPSDVKFAREWQIAEECYAETWTVGGLLFRLLHSVQVRISSPDETRIYCQTPHGHICVKPIFQGKDKITFGTDADGWIFSQPISCGDQEAIWSRPYLTVQQCLASCANRYENTYRQTSATMRGWCEDDSGDENLESLTTFLFGEEIAEAMENTPLFAEKGPESKFPSYYLKWPIVFEKPTDKDLAAAADEVRDLEEQVQTYDHDHPITHRLMASEEFLTRSKEYYGTLNYFSLRTVIKQLMRDCHDAAKEAGWWDQERPVPEMIALMHSELSEMLEGDRKDTFDGHLPHRSSVEVEAADLLIRLMDFAGGLDLDLAGAYLEKRAYNATREDHRREVRAKQGGKKY